LKNSAGVLPLADATVGRPLEQLPMSLCLVSDFRATIGVTPGAYVSGGIAG
jgi:hypothetical protein